MISSDSIKLQFVYIDLWQLFANGTQLILLIGYRVFAVEKKETIINKMDDKKKGDRPRRMTTNKYINLCTYNQRFNAARAKMYRQTIYINNKRG